MPATGPYDQDLLASAPAATKAQLQEGYATDLLQPNRGRDASPNADQSERAPPTPQPDPERDSISPSKELNGHATKTAFWRTTKGIIIIIVVILVVIGAVVGGAVGGTRKSGGGATVAGAAAASGATSAVASGGGGLSAGSNPGPTTTQTGVGPATPLSTVPGASTTTPAGIVPITATGPGVGQVNTTKAGG